MAGIREDYIERMIERLAAALAAILKAGKAQKAEEALDLVHQTSLSLFGMEYRMLITIDAGSVAELLGHPEKIKALAKLVRAEAALLQQRGDSAGVSHRFRHALALLQEAQRRRATPDPELERLLRDETASLSRLDPAFRGGHQV
jgi:dsRNA-specific ribonuclease